MRLQLDWYPDAERGGYVCALVNGFYREAGLDVEILSANPANPQALGLVFGQVDVALGQSDDIMMSRLQGIPLVSVMATMQHNPLGIMVHAESPVHNFSDLEGRGVAVGPGASWFRYLAHKYQLKKIQEQRITPGVGNFMVNPNLIQQAFVTSEPYLCEKNHVNIRMLLVKDSGYDPYRVVVTSERFLKSSPDALHAFVTASIHGWQTYLGDSPQAAKADAEILKLNPTMTQDLINYSRKALREQGFVAGSPEKGEAVGKFDPARFAAMAAIMKSLQLLPAAFDEKSSYTLDFCGSQETPR